MIQYTRKSRKGQMHFFSFYHNVYPSKSKINKVKPNKIPEHEFLLGLKKEKRNNEGLQCF